GEDWIDRELGGRSLTVAALIVSNRKETGLTEATEAKHQPLTLLTPDEQLFQSSVRQFAKERIAPLVREMDEKAVFDRKLLDEFFRLGWMGIEVPEEYGGSGETFFHSVIAIEELSAVDP